MMTVLRSIRVRVCAGVVIACGGGMPASEAGAESAAPDGLAGLLSRQSPSGGWPKTGDHRPTIDNGATVREMRRLAPDESVAAREAFRRGLDWLLAAQYRSGGWPQNFPLTGGYHDRITFNDDAMAGALTLLRDIGAGTTPFGFTTESEQERCRAAVARGTACLLACQIRISGTPTGWCQQHDETTLVPAPGRAFEPAALATAETVGIVRFLMGESKSSGVVAAIEEACAWLNRTRLPDGRWPRCIEIGTGRPIFAGRDGVIRYRVEELDLERRKGYAWFIDRPRTLLERDLPRWRRAVSRP